MRPHTSSQNVSTSECGTSESGQMVSPGAEASAETSAGHVASHRPELSPRKLQSIESRKQLADPGQEREATSPAAKEVDPVPEKEGPRKTSSRRLNQCSARYCEQARTTDLDDSQFCVDEFIPP